MTRQLGDQVETALGAASTRTRKIWENATADYEGPGVPVVPDLQGPARVPGLRSRAVLDRGRGG